MLKLNATYQLIFLFFKLYVFCYLFLKNPKYVLFVNTQRKTHQKRNRVIASKSNSTPHIVIEATHINNNKHTRLV